MTTTEPAVGHDYSLRGRCRELAERLAEQSPELILIRGYYYCSVWGRQPHWWCQDTDGRIVDPSARQFPSLGSGVYEPFDGTHECEYCGMGVGEGEAYTYGHHVYCSERCFGWDVLG